MIIQCTSCQARFRFDESKLDGQSSKKVRCSKCGATFTVYAPQPAPTPLVPDESEEAPPPAFASQKSDPFSALAAAPPPPAERKKAVLKPVVEDERKPQASDSFIIPVAEYNASLTSSATIGVFSNSASRSEIPLAPLRAEELSSINIELPAQFGQQETNQDQSGFMPKSFMTSNQDQESDPGNSTTIKLSALDDRDNSSSNSESYASRTSINREYYQNEERNLKLAPLVRALREVEFDNSDPTMVLQIASTANIPTVRTSGKGGRTAVAYQIQPFSGVRSQAAAAANADLPKALILLVKAGFILAFLAVLLFGSLVALGGERFNPTRLNLATIGLGDPIQAPPAKKSAEIKP